MLLERLLAPGGIVPDVEVPGRVEAQCGRELQRDRSPVGEHGVADRDVLRAGGDAVPKDARRRRRRFRHVEDAQAIGRDRECAVAR
jgi:hypothetical protein